MAEMEKVEFEFPDEVEAKGKEEAAPPAEELEAKNTPEIEIEVEDDTPPEDRGRQPLPKEVVQKLEIEVNERDQYSEDAKKKMIQMKKVWNDERRRADAADRERQEALEATRRLHEENKRMKELLSNGEKEYLAAMKTAADLQLEMAKKSYKDAYEAGDSEGMMNAQQSITNDTHGVGYWQLSCSSFCASTTCCSISSVIPSASIIFLFYKISLLMVLC